jgi:hypothetical protein
MRVEVPPRTPGHYDGVEVTLYGGPHDACATPGCGTILRGSNPYDRCERCLRHRLGLGEQAHRRNKRTKGEDTMAQRERIRELLDQAEFLEWVPRPDDISPGSWQGRICDLRKAGEPVETGQGGMARWQPSSEQGQALRSRPLDEPAETMSEQEDPELFNPPGEGGSIPPDVRATVQPPAPPAFAGQTGAVLKDSPLLFLPQDPELAAITKAVDALESLSAWQRARVIDYLKARYLEEG